MREKYLQIISDKRLIYRLYKELPELNNNNKTTQFTNGKRLESSFLLGKYAKTKRYMKKFSPSLVIREIQIRITMRTPLHTREVGCYFFKLGGGEWQVLARIQRNWVLCTLLVGILNGAAAIENILAVHQKVKHRIIT